MSEGLQLIRYLARHGQASLVDLARAAHPEAFAAADVARCQAVIERIEACCARLVNAHVLVRAYSPTDGEPVYCVREFFTREPAAGVGPDDAPTPLHVRYAVFFKFGGTAIRPACEEVLQHLTGLAPRARHIGVTARTPRGAGAVAVHETIARRRAELVVGRLIGMGVGRECIDLSIRPQDEQPFPEDLFCADPPRNWTAQARRVDIELRMP